MLERKAVKCFRVVYTRDHRGGPVIFEIRADVLPYPDEHVGGPAAFDPAKLIILQLDLVLGPIQDVALEDFTGKDGA